MSYYLFLDDERMPEQVTWVRLPKVDWVIVRNFAQFRDCIETNGFPRFIAFDHDLGMNEFGKMEPSGMDCARWLVDVCLDSWTELPDFVSHSMNPGGRRNIEAYLTNFKQSQRRG